MLECICVGPTQWCSATKAPEPTSLVHVAVEVILIGQEFKSGLIIEPGLILLMETLAFLPNQCFQLLS